MLKTTNKIQSGAKKILDMTVGNLGFGAAYVSAYAAEAPVLGLPFASLNEGVARGYNRASTQILASKIAKGKIKAEDAYASLDPEAKAHLRNAVERQRGHIGANETIDAQTGEIGGFPGITEDDLPAHGASA